jgi:anti-sigma regulatory factor (Ser/Thr protein kinase)
MNANDDPSDDVVRLSFPARPGFLRLSRINVTTFGSELGFTVDELDDLRLAVDEAVHWLLRDENPSDTVLLELREVAHGVELRATRSGTALPDQPVGDLIHAILGATVDGYELQEDPTGRTVVLSKRRAVTPQP